MDRKKLLDWVEEPLRRRVYLGDAWQIIKRHYCAALVGRGVCPGDCEKCREAIVSLFGFDGAKNPEALLTWRAKDRSAVMIERLIADEKFPVLETKNTLDTLFPKKRGENLFLEMAQDYD